MTLHLQDLSHLLREMLASLWPDHCEEEEQRLSRECTIMQEWFMREWASTVHAEEAAASVYVQWESKVCHITTAWKMGPSWGPTSSEAAHAVYAQFHANVMQGSLGGEDDEAEEKDKEENVGSDEGSGLEDDNDVRDAVEDMALAEEYGLWEEMEEDSGEDEDWDDGNLVPSSPVKGPVI
ncbi:hypothetical protein BS17DRAFT_766584 [Gyrodon lividus]|nr:hypothetical protein BS17DRAFT_766584 [Gyrodon lividus]